MFALVKAVKDLRNIVGRYPCSLVGDGTKNRFPIPHQRKRYFSLRCEFEGVGYKIRHRLADFFGVSIKRNALLYPQIEDEVFCINKWPAVFGFICNQNGKIKSLFL